MSSVYESFGLATAEALAHGLPAVGFADCPGTNELIESGINGILVSGDDRVEALAAGLETAMGDPQLRQRMSARGPDSVAEFSVEHIVDRWEGLLDEVISRRTLRAGFTPMIAPADRDNEPFDNIDTRTVVGFGEEWAHYTQDQLPPREQRRMFDLYFGLLRFDELPPGAEGFDLGCGSGRWAELVRERVGYLHCIDPSEKALAVAQSRLVGHDNVAFHVASVDRMPLPDASQDFGYSLGVLHHIPDPAAGLAACVSKLKPGAPLLLYIYYAFDNRPSWFRLVWAGSNMLRRGICRLPFRARKSITDLIAATVYWPLARTAQLASRARLPVESFPLSAYRDNSFYTMRTDSLDRFGTSLEHRFTRGQIEAMMVSAGLEDIRFQDSVPYWVAIGRRKKSA